MIPILYEATETAFVTNGLGRLRDCISAVVTEERNGIFEFEFDYPVDGHNFDLITCGRIVAVTHDDTGDVQPFDIVSYSKPIDGIVTFHAVHISYRQTGMVATGSNVDSLAAAFTLLKSASPDNPFTYEADFTSTAYFAAADGVPHSVKQMLGGMEGSVLDTYGGEFTWDRFRVILNKNRGTLRPFSIRYGVNMVDYSDETDFSESYTSVIPYWTGDDGKGGQTIVVGNKVDSGLASYNGRDICVPLELTDKFEAKPTKAALQDEALAFVKSHQVNQPAQTISVDFLRLQDVGEYDQIANLLTCQLCDTIRVYFPAYGMTGTYKIVKTEWDVLEGRYLNCELGSLSTSLAEALGITTGTASFVEGQGGAAFTPTLKTLNGANTITSGTTLQALGINESMDSGYWIIAASIRYSSNSAGYRSLIITNNGTQAPASLVQHPAGGTGNVDMMTTAMIRATSSWTLDLQARQNSGSTMNNVPWYIEAMKVGEV